MIKKQFRISDKPSYIPNFNFNINDILYFDIETTGFSAQNNFLYIIGCAYYFDNTYNIIQWFSEGPLEEKELIISFLEFSKNFKAIIHYNGQAFDLPFLKKKIETYGLKYNFDHLHSIDVYKKVLSIRNLLNLDNYKQKTVEGFLNINRIDKFSGGELIDVYKSYLTSKKLEDMRGNENLESNKLLYTLLLHNEDDLKGLLNIMPIFTYVDFFTSSINLLSIKQVVDNLIIKFDFNSTLPVPITIENPHYSAELTYHYGLITIPIINAELKYFYADYKNYYYLTHEDLAIHKSIASFVDSKYKEKARANNCYTKKNGNFIPLLNPVIEPNFKKNYKDNISYIELTDCFYKDNKIIKIYIEHIIENLKKTK